MKKGLMQFVVRLSVFILLGGLVVPFLIKLIAKMVGASRTIVVNNTYMPLFVLAILVIFVLHNRKKLLAIKEYKLNVFESLVFFIVSLLLFTLHFLFSYIVSGTFAGTHLYLVVGVIYLSQALGLVFLGLGLFNYFFFKKFRISILISIIAGALFFVFTFLLRLGWRFFSGAVAKMVYWILNLMFDVRISVGLGDPSLRLNEFSVIIGSPCSGVASLTMFATLYLAIAALDWRLLDKKKLALLFIPGLVGMFLMTILRILVLMIVGAFFSEELALTLFHTNLGWLLFVVYMLGFWYVSYPYMKR
ncbi:archaeosortase/exosortase family protein [Nanoarchaeota archaeon]